MSAVSPLASPMLEGMIADRRLWRGKPAALPPSTQPTGYAALDAALPTHGWPESSLAEILLPVDGVGELQVLLPTLVRLTRAKRRVVLITPPYTPYAPAWRAAGVDLAWLSIVEATSRDMAWAMEQALRSGSCGAVLGWLTHANDRTLRRLEVAATTGAALGFVFRDRAAIGNPSPAALRLEVGIGQLRVHKCRGGNPPPPIVFAPAWSHGSFRESARPGNAEPQLGGRECAELGLGGPGREAESIPPGTRTNRLAG